MMGQSRMDGSNGPVTRPLRRIVLAIGAAVAVSFVAAACGLPTDDRVTPYNVNDIPDQLTEPTTTTTSTTTTTTTTTMPPPTLPGETTTSTSSTSTLPIVLEPITVYYTIGSSDDLRPLDVNRGEDPSPQEVVAALESSTGLTQIGLRTSVRPGLIADVRLERGVATIVLEPSVLTRMPEAQQRRAIAQMVLTFTSFKTTDQGNIGYVTFESDGEPYEVFVPIDDDMSEPGGLLAFADFAEMIATASAPTATAPIETDPETTTTTVPDTTTTTTSDEPG
jgi:hypothetical protein